MDEIDRKIIQILQEDASTPLTRIADIIGIPKPTAYLRFNKMKDEGIIKGFNIVLGKMMKGERKAAVLRIRDYLLSDMGPRTMKYVGEKLAKRSEVLIAARISSDTIFLVWEGDTFTPEKLDGVINIEYVKPEVFKGC